jgi:hypothetical protein
MSFWFCALVAEWLAAFKREGGPAGHCLGATLERRGARRAAAASDVPGPAVLPRICNVKSQPAPRQLASRVDK